MAKKQNVYRNAEYLPALVTDDLSGEYVARAIIDSGLQNEPFYIFDMDEARRHIQLFRTNMPRVQMFYAIKANDTEMMVRLVIAMGIGFDCATPGEINRILSYNVDPTSIIYAMPIKTPEQMQYARESGVKHTTFNTSCELKKIKQYWPDAKLLIRLKVDSDSIYKLSDKFGCDFETEAIDLLEEAASLQLTVIGVAFHVGSACYSLDSYVVALRQARAVFDYEAKAGRRMKILDIGGGFFCEDITMFEKASKIINNCLDDLFPDSDVQIIAEPGRFLCEAAFKLYCHVLNVRKTKMGNKPINLVHITDGVNGTLRFMERWHKVRKFSSNSTESDIVEDTILFGPTPDLKDHMAVLQLPQCSPEDWLEFTMQGAYTVTFAGNYAGFNTPKIRPVISRSFWNEIKDSPVFNEGDFIVNAEIIEALPTSLPPVLPYSKHEYINAEV